MRKDQSQKNLRELKDQADEILNSIPSLKNEKELNNLMEITIFKEFRFRVLHSPYKKELKEYIEGLIQCQITEIK